MGPLLVVRGGSGGGVDEEVHSLLVHCFYAERKGGVSV